MNIIIAEDQRMLLGALAALLSMEDDIHVIAQANNGKDALNLIRTYEPDLCMLDIEMPIMSGLDVAEAVKEEDLPSKVIILTLSPVKVTSNERCMPASAAIY